MTTITHTCQISTHFDPYHLPESLLHAADALACLLSDTPEFQNFVRMDHGVRMDEEVKQIRYQLDGLIEAETSQDELEARLEALPILQEYQRSQQSARNVFAAIEKVISASAGLPFAENAKPAGFA